MGILWGSVVANINTTKGGGSSRVLRRALKADLESMWTSSIMYILYLPSAGAYLTLSLSSPYVIHVGIGRAVYLKDVHRMAARYGLAQAARVARLGGRAVNAVQALGEYAGDCRFFRPPLGPEKR